jgi:hypothetical protein
LLKFFKTQNIRKELMLLEHLIAMWDVTEQVFRVGPLTLDIKLENIYFITSLLKWGALIILSGFHGRDITIDGYV